MQVWQAILTQRIDFNARELRGISSSARDLLGGLLDRDPTLRLTAQQALEHPWIKVGTHMRVTDLILPLGCSSDR